MSKFEKFLEIINGSMRYEFSGTELTVTGYYTGESVTINLAAIPEEAFDEIVKEDEEEW